MCQFPYPLTYFFDGLDGDAPKLALEIKGVAVGDFTKSECGRFEGIDPQDYYGLSTEDIRQFALLKETVVNASQEAINAGCRQMQSALGIAAGDFFSSDKKTT